ncbi:MAG TPA: hypothetical protein DCX54_08265 [Flavobacteriales bacterium]|nr:hypothetical protein [Flavobacteriales bacterium]
MTTHKNVSDWYDRKYRETGDQTRRSVKAFYQIMKLIPASADSILDVGCGRGEFLEYLNNKGFKNLAAVDISEEAIKGVKQLLPDCDARVSTGEKMPFADNQFSLITCLGVLEHFLDIDGGLNEMNRILKEGGKAIIMVPNKNFIGWIFTKKDHKGTQQKEISETLYSVSTWKHKIETSGFTVKNIKADNGFIYNNRDLKTKNLKYFIKRILFILLPLIPNELVYQVIFESVKIPRDANE